MTRTARHQAAQSRPRRGRPAAITAAGLLLLQAAVGAVVPGNARAAGAPTVPPAAYPAPGLVIGDTEVHDPSIVKRPGGGYLVAATGDGIPLKTSIDRITFHNAGAAFPGGTPWAASYTGGSTQLWAPDISVHNSLYYLYYAASTFGSNRSAIFLATSTSGDAGTWTHRGMVIESSVRDTWNAIDPDLEVDASGRWYLTFGSFWSGIKQVRLNPSTGLRSNSTMLSVAGRGGGAIEAPMVVKHGSYYYLWVSFDLCCRGAASSYRIMVGRSTRPTGPFVDRRGKAMTAGGGTEVLAGRGATHGPGQPTVLTDVDGDVLVYHYYADSGASFLGINLIGYDKAGWPFVY